jgi:hypothetical protein
MKTFAFLFAAGLCLAFSHVSAAEAKDYQVTGPVLEVTPSYIVVQKGEEKWQVGVSKDTKNATVKVGDKVTVYYKMIASEIEVKPAKADKPAKAEPKK